MRFQVFRTLSHVTVSIPQIRLMCKHLFVLCFTTFHLRRRSFIKWKKRTRDPGDKLPGSLFYGVLWSFTWSASATFLHFSAMKSSIDESHPVLPLPQSSSPQRTRQCPLLDWLPCQNSLLQSNEFFYQNSLFNFSAFVSAPHMQCTYRIYLPVHSPNLQCK